MTNANETNKIRTDWNCFIAQAKKSLQVRFDLELDHIESALKAGRTYSEVLAHLNANGFELKKGSFPNMLYRARVRKKLRDVKRDPEAQVPATVAPTEAPRNPRQPVKRPDQPPKLIWDPHKETKW